MIRRVQLLDAESRPSRHRLATIGYRIRDGLLRDNKVVPAVVGFLALLIFAWLVAGAVIGGSGEEERASNQASFAQGEDSESKGPETPAPGVENRDTDSYSAFKSKDPFATRDIIGSKAGSSGANNNQSPPSQGGGNQGGSTSSSGGSKSGSSSSGSSKSGSSSGGSPKSGSSSSGRPGGGGSGQDSTDQSFPGAGQDSSAQPGAPQSGTGSLFNSGGDLLPP